MYAGVLALLCFLLLSTYVLKCKCPKCGSRYTEVWYKGYVADTVHCNSCDTMWMELK